MDEYTKNFWNRMSKLEEKLLSGEDPFSPFTDKMAKHAIDAHNTQHGIIKYMEAMAQVMAEAALASQKSVGDSPFTAIDKWTRIVSQRAKELIREKAREGEKKLPDHSKTIDHEG